MMVNIPEVVAEVEKAFKVYELALNENDVAVLNELFWDSPHTLRFGINEQLYGYAAIQGFRSGRPAIDLRRDLLKVVITTYGRDFAIASCEYRRKETGRIGRQMQTWARINGDWRVVAAHVSLLPA
jgi:hypothetical protein